MTAAEELSAVASEVSLAAMAVADILSALGSCETSGAQEIQGNTISWLAMLLLRQAEDLAQASNDAAVAEIAAMRGQVEASP